MNFSFLVFHSKNCGAIFLLGVAILLIIPGFLRAGTLPMSDALNQLIHDVNFWEERGNFQAAIIDLKRVLKEDPSNQNALLDFGILLAEEGDEKKARVLLSRLDKLYPGSRSRKILQMAIREGKIDSSILSQAREEAQSRHYNKAIILYKLAYHGLPLNDFQALEYYLTLSGIPQKKNEAIENLGKILKKHPNNERIQLAIADELIDKESSRRNGIRILSTLALADSKKISRKALSDWRAALIWLQAAPSDRILYESYLNYQPLDREIRKKLAEIPARSELADGYRFLKNNNERNALKHFEKAMEENPLDGDIAGAIGIVRLRQRRYEEAISVFRWSLSHQGDPHSFLKPLRIAQAQYYLEMGRRFLFSGNLEKARSQFEKVLLMDSKNSEAYFELGIINRYEKNYSESIKLDERSLSIDPSYYPAALDLVTSLILGNKLSQAQREFIRFHKIIPSRAKRRLKAQILKNLGERDLNSEKFINASDKFSKAAKLLPSDPWIQFDLAETLLKENHLRQATGVMRKFLKTYPTSEIGAFAGALFYEKVGDFQKARFLLMHIPYDKWTPPIRNLSTRLSADWFDRQAQLLAKKGHNKTAQKWETISYLIQGKKDVGQDFSLNLALARLSAKAKNYTDSLDRYGSLIEQNPRLWFLFREALGIAIAGENKGWVDRLEKHGLVSFSYNPELYELLGDWAEKDSHWKKALNYYLKAFFLSRENPDLNRIRQASLQAKIRKAQTILIAKESSHSYVEILGGETILSQGSQFYMGEIGGFIPFVQNPDDRSLLNPPFVHWGFRWLVMGDFLHYPILSTPSTLSPNVNQVSLNGVNAALGIRGSFENAFLDLLIGPSWGISAQTRLPFKNELDWYGQIEYGQNTRWGFLDLYGNYVGILQYLYGQARFLAPLTLANKNDFVGKISLGPEAIFQGNNTYNDGQIGGAIQFPLWFSNASLLFDGGFLRSNLSVGYGGYEGTYVDIRF